MLGGKERKYEKVTYHWKLLDGAPCSMTLFDATTSEADEAARACGWPGHSNPGGNHVK
jgi:hypothetical protein